MTDRARRRTVYMSVAAQESNLGDVEIRREAMGWVRDSGLPLVAYTGRMGPEYLAAFDFDPGTRFIDGSARFVGLLLSAAARRRAHLVFAPGPTVLGSSPQQVVKAASNAAFSAAVRLGGGQVLALGRAVRGSGALAVAMERLVARSCSYYLVRDPVSARLVGAGAAVIPDIGLGRRLDPRTELRDTLAISLRGDRPLDPDRVRSWVEQGRALGLQSVFVSQVERDDARHHDLAARFGAGLVAWGTGSHEDRLERVDEAYARAAVVVSDRLHALVFAATHGAGLVALIHPGEDKLATTLHGVLPVVDVPGDDEDECVAVAHARRQEVVEAVVRARQVLSLARANTVRSLVGPSA